MKLKRIYNSKYKWEVVENYSIKLQSLNKCTSQAYITDKGNEIIISINNNALTICGGYQFDGCTYAPDFDRALIGCGIHDALIQLLKTYPGMFELQDAHNALLEVHKKTKFRLKWLYYRAVSSWLGDIYNYYKNR
jgi:hypothetical protein